MREIPMEDLTLPDGDSTGVLGSWGTRAPMTVDRLGGFPEI
jgi:hypothetical protein